MNQATVNERRPDGPCWACLTRYYELYRHSYWGCFRTYRNPAEGEDPHHPGEDVLRNRNMLADLLGLKSWAVCKSAWAARVGDHQEAYRTQDGGVVILASPYNDGALLGNLGMVQVLPMYVHGASSWLIRCVSLKDARLFLEQQKTGDLRLADPRRFATRSIPRELLAPTDPYHACQRLLNRLIEKRTLPKEDWKRLAEMAYDTAWYQAKPGDPR